MGNVLGELFTRMANSIRGGLGDIGKMAPDTFPDRVDEIVAMLKKAVSGEGDTGGSGSGGGPATGLRSKAISMTLTGANGSRVAIDFGFKPLMIVIYPDNKLSVANSTYFTCIGSVSELGFSERISYVYSNKITTQLQGGYIDGDDINKPIYNADETGFNLGKTFGSGTYIIYAIG